MTPNDGDEGGPCSLHTSTAAGYARISVRGDLGERAVDALEQAVLASIANGAYECSVDLTDLTWVDARSVERLLALRIDCALRRVALRFTRPARELAGALDDPRVCPPLSFTE